MKDKVFKSKADIWILLVLGGSIAITLFSMLNLNSIDKASPALKVILLIILAASVCLVLSILFYTRYIVRGQQLIIRCGPFVQRIDIDRIHTVKLKARTILSSPRLSWDTLGILYNKYDDVFISPRAKEAFIEALKAINSSIEVK